MDAGTVALLHSPLVGHRGAGPLLGAVGAGLRSAGRPAGGYLFCDAGLPEDGASRLDLLAAEDREMAAAFREELEPGGEGSRNGPTPTWSRWSPTRPRGRRWSGRCGR